MSLFYTYIVLHDCIESYKCIYFYIYMSSVLDLHLHLYEYRLILNTYT